MGPLKSKHYFSLFFSFAILSACGDIESLLESGSQQSPSATTPEIDSLPKAPNSPLIDELFPPSEPDASEDEASEPDTSEPEASEEENLGDEASTEEDLSEKDVVEVSEESEAPVVEEVSPASSYIMIAAKSYSPSAWENFEVELSAKQVFELPKSIEVLEGNAGNHWVSLWFDDVECRYKGGSAQSKPNNAKQWEKGLTYELDSCGGEKVSKKQMEIAAASSLFLQVHNGDSRHTTVVKVEVWAADSVE